MRKRKGRGARLLDYYGGNGVRTLKYHGGDGIKLIKYHGGRSRKRSKRMKGGFIPLLPLIGTIASIFS